MAEKQQVIEKANQICEECKFDLGESFIEKFAEKFAETYADVDIEDEGLARALNISISSSGHARKKTFSELTDSFKAKEAEYKSELDKLKKGTKKEETKEEKSKFELPEELKQKLDLLDVLQRERKETQARSEIMNTAKKDIREDLIDSFEKYVSKQNINFDKPASEEAKRLVGDFQEIFRSSVGETKPFYSGGKKASLSDLLKDIQPQKI